MTPEAKYFSAFSARKNGEAKALDFLELCTRTMLEGAATTSCGNSHGDRILPAGCSVARLPVPLCLEHKKQIGEVLYLRKIEAALFCRATIFDHEVNVWRAFKSGELNALSVSVELVDDSGRQDAEGFNVFDSWTLKEISLCQRGANHEAHCWPWLAPKFCPVDLKPYSNIWSGHAAA